MNNIPPRFWAFEFCKSHLNANDPSNWEIAPGRFAQLRDAAEAAGCYLMLQADNDEYPSVKLIPIE